MCGRVYPFGSRRDRARYTGAKGPTPNIDGGEMDVAPTDDLTVLCGTGKQRNCAGSDL